jgi:hypothetical protein
MKERATQLLLAAAAGLLAALLLRPTPAVPSARAEGAESVPAVLRAQAIELVNPQGRVVAQLHLGEDGGGNLRLRCGDGTVRVKLSASPDGSGLLLCDRDVEPAIWMVTGKSGTSVTLAEKGKEKRVLKP